MKKIFLTIYFISGLAYSSFAETVTLKTYMAAPAWNYSQIRLGAKSTLPSPCTIGTFAFYNGALTYCEENSGNGQWSNAGMASVWSKTGDNIYATDYSNPNLKVGIGTSTPSMKLTVSGGLLALGGDEGLSVGGAGIRFMWYPYVSAFRAGKVRANEWDNANIGPYSAVIGGTDSSVSSSHSTIGAGHDSHISSIGDNNIVAGGEGNIINGGDSSAIAAGTSNTTSSAKSFMGASSQSTIDANSDHSAILSGLQNQITGGANANTIILGGNYNTINGADNSAIATGYNNVIETGALNSFIATGNPVVAGAQNNIITQPNSAIATGSYNQVRNLLAGDSSFIGSGHYQEVSGIGSFIGTGILHKIVGNYCFIGAGRTNEIQNAGLIPTLENSAIFSGEHNIISNNNSFIGAGDVNTVNGDRSAIVSGWKNTINGTSSFIGAGHDLQVDGNFSAILAGDYATLNATNAFIGAGQYNNITAAAEASAIFTGRYNTISGLASFIGGGTNNTINGDYSVISGGGNNTVDGDYSMAMGQSISLTAAADRTFAYGHFPGLDISTPDAFITYNVKVGIDTDTIAPDELLKLSGGAYSDGANWTPISSIESKERIKDLQYLESLKAFHKLKPVKFNYKSDDEPYIGFIAEDVPSLLAVRKRDSISSMDVVAVLTKFIQGQQKIIEEQEKELKNLEKKIQNF